MKVRWILPAVLFVLLSYRALADRLPNAIPELNVYKTGFAEGENIAFTIGLKGIDNRELEVERAAGETGRVVVNGPNGKKASRPVSLSYSGFGSNYLLGYNWIPKELVHTGKYTLVFEYRGKKSQPVVVTVSKLPLLSQIHAVLRLDASPGFPEGLSEAHAMLSVQNDTDRTIRFAKLNGVEGLSFGVKVLHGAWEGRTFDTGWLIRRQASSAANPEDFTWDAAETLPTVTLKPGEKYEQSIPLQPTREVYMNAYKQEPAIPAGDYLVHLERTFSLLIGDRNDPDARFYPVRIPLTAQAIFTTSTAK